MIELFLAIPKFILLVILGIIVVGGMNLIIHADYVLVLEICVILFLIYKNKK